MHRACLPPSHTVVAATAAVAVSTLAAACAPAAGTSTPPVSALRLTDAWPRILLPSTWLRVAGEGFPLPEEGELFVWFEGDAPDGPVSVRVPAEVEPSRTIARAPLGAALADAGVPRETPLTGRIAVERVLSWAATSSRVETEHQVTLELRDTLVPVVHDIAVRPHRVGDAVVIEGDGFLLPEEGTVLVSLTGIVRTGGAPVRALAVTSDPLELTDRTRASFRLPPAWLATVPATLEGTARILDRLPDGTTTASEPVTLSWSIEPPRLDGIEPGVVRRGQWLRLRGAGLLAPDSDGTAMTALVLEGTFEPLEGDAPMSWQGASARVWLADGGPGDNEVWVAMRALSETPSLWVGPAAQPGRFQGTARVAIASATHWLWSPPIDVTFRIARPLQRVWLRYLPGFSGAIEAFGLGPLEPDIRARIAEVLARDYEGISIDFTEVPPSDWFEYSIVEVGGDDPNGAGLLGLDNTAGKDEGNLRFDDVVGGFNAETSAQGFYPYGGIFVASFFQFSPTLGAGQNPLEDDRFDVLFGPFAPSLGGEPITPTELAHASPRAEAARDAAYVLGNLIGGTIAHEVGHTLGLSAEPGRFHNEGDHPNWLMDAGIYRPFGERAEIDGEGPELFSPTNRAYLLEILPPDEGGSP